MPITLRAVVPDDDEFLCEVYASTRRDEVAAWGWDAAQQDAFLKMQQLMQRRAYEMQYPQSDHHLIIFNDQPAGRLFVVRTTEEILLADIALLPEYRGRGIGTTLIKELLDEGEREKLPVRLQVLKNNPATRLYERLGFVTTGESDLYFHMLATI